MVSPSEIISSCAHRNIFPRCKAESARTSSGSTLMATWNLGAEKDCPPLPNKNGRIPLENGGLTKKIQQTVRNRYTSTSSVEGDAPTSPSWLPCQQLDVWQIYIYIELVTAKHITPGAPCMYSWICLERHMLPEIPSPDSTGWCPSLLAKLTKVYGEQNHIWIGIIQPTKIPTWWLIPLRYSNHNAPVVGYNPIFEQ